MTKQGRPRGGEHHPEVREYWREQKGYKRKKDPVDDLVKLFLGDKKR